MIGERIGHVGLVVQDMRRSVQFYERLGLRVERTMVFPGRDITIMCLDRPSDAKLELLRYEQTDLAQRVPDDRTRLGLRHLAIHVADIKSAFAALITDGVVMLPDPPFQQANGPAIAFGMDPDGVLLEFTEID